MREWLRARPWIWILVLMALLLGLSLAFVLIASQEPPIPVVP